ncbi:MAG: VOC family protein [Pseudomonadales bacterium]
MIVGFHHPGLVVSDLALAQKFYHEALGFEYIRDYGWDESASEMAEQVLDVKGTTTECVLMKGNNCFLELFKYLTPEPQGDPMARRACDYGVAHLAFQVTDITEAFARFKAAGGVVHHEPVQAGEAWSTYCRDPFGNIIELMQLGSDEPDFDLIAEKLLPASVQL